jgi:NO-binding membrane sensor protein with MHYT domain
MHVDYRASWVLLACAISFIGTHAAVSLGEQFRIALSSVSADEKPEKRIFLLILVACSLGGAAFWGVFYVTMTSIRLRTDTNTIVPLFFDPTYVAASVFVTSFITYIGLYIASKDECFDKSTKDIMELFILRTSRTRTIGEIKRMGKMKILFSVCTTSLHQIVAGGVVSGGALCLMIYMGMKSVRMSGRVVSHPGSVAAAMICAMFGVTLVYWLFFRVLSVFPSMDILRKVCSLTGMIVICGVYYLNIAGLEFEYNASEKRADDSVTTAKVIVSVLTSTVLFSFLMLVCVLADLRRWLLRTSTQLHMADRALLSLLNRQSQERQHVTVTPNTSSSATSAHGTSTSMNGVGVSGRASSKTHQHLLAPPEVVKYTAKYLRPYMQQHFSPTNSSLYYENVPQSSSNEDGMLDAQIGNRPEVSPQDTDLSRSGVPSTSSVLRASASGRVIPASLAVEARYLVGETGDDENAFELGNLGIINSGVTDDEPRFLQNV